MAAGEVLEGRLFEVKVPDIGDFEAVDVVEVLVEAGQRVAVEDSLITLESDKAAMEVPSPVAGEIVSLSVAVGDQVSEGHVIVTVRLAAGAEDGERGGESRGAAAPVSAGRGAGRSAERSAGRSAERSAGAAESSADGRAAGAEGVQTAGVAADRAQPKRYQRLVVVGSGPGGYAAAFRAADLGLDVTLVERYPTLGGVCLNVGCIPSKALLHAAKLIDEAAAFAEHGIEFGRPTLDLARLRGWKESVVGRLTGGLDQLAKRRKVKVVHGTARFASAHRLEVESGGGSQAVDFDAAIVAVGSRSIELAGIPHEHPRVLDSTSALELADAPERLLVIGGGIIGMEMATVYAALGSRVSVVELTDGLMPGCDRDLVRPLLRRVKAAYESVWLETRVVAAKAADDGVEVEMEGKEAPASERFDRILVAVGRRPNGDRIATEKAGIAVDGRGFIAVDDQQRTNVEHIFAIGDVVPGPMLAHKATHEGKVAAEVAAGERSGFDARVIPSVAYTDPEVAWVGLTELAAKESGIAFEKGSFPWSASGRSLALGRDDGLTKLLFDPESGRVLGAGMVGTNAGDLVAEAALAIEMGADAHDLGLTIHPHPTLSETLAFAAEAWAGTITDLYLPKKKR